MSGVAQNLGMVRHIDQQAVKGTTMLIARGATENVLENELIPEAEFVMLDYTALDKPEK